MGDVILLKNEITKGDYLRIIS